MEIPVYVSKNGEKKETISWDYFITKAAKGAWDASEELALAADTLIATKMNRETGWGWNGAEMAQVLGECLGERPRLFQDFLRQLIGLECLPEGMQSSGQAFHAHEKYEHLWGCSWQPLHDELTHDAALYCFENWLLSSFMKLWETYSADNAQDLVALMLLIVLCDARLS